MKEFLRKFDKGMKVLAKSGPRRAALRHRVMAGVDHHFVLAGFPADLIVDAGANRGHFSLAARHYHPQARIIAFEPQPRPASVFRRIFAKDPKVVLHACALGTQKGSAVMQVSGQDHSSSMLPISELQSSYFSGTAAAGTLDVAVAPLTDFVGADDLAGPSLLKIDVQGFELEVLKSAIPILSGFDRVYVELSFVTFYEGQPLVDEIIGFLRAQGFVMTGFYNARYDVRNGAVLQADFLFENSRR